MNPPSPFKQSVHTGWTVRAVGDVSQVPAQIRGRAVPATVPGCIHTDLMDAGLIPDAAMGDNEREVQWVSWTDWRYGTSFEADPRLFEHHEIDLVFECLDTIAAVELNGDKVGEAASEFMPHRFSVLGLLKPGMNRLAVTFTSPLRYVHEQAARLGPRPVNGDWDPFVFIRKCASNFQWDWGPKVATCGIAADVRFVGWSYARINKVIPRWDRPERCRVVVEIRMSSRGLDVPIELSGSMMLAPDGDEPARRPLEGFLRTPRQDPWVLDIETANADRWWPHGAGAQNRYPLHLELSMRGRVLDSWQRLVARRDIKLGATGGEFTLTVNDRPVFCKGANWIPEGLWPRDRTPERVRKRLQQLVDANMNMVRVWGGGRYEPDWFYDLCDEMGIMVWQDFMFSCGMYPEEDPYPALIEAEARHQVARLSRHPSVVFWCGGNECTWAHESWGWKEKLKPGQTWGRRYWLDMLPKIVAELDPTRPYWPNSPWSGDETKPNDTERGDRHTWDVWGDGYRRIVPRFCSEFGQQAPSNVTTLREAGLIPDISVSSPFSAPLTGRQRGPGGNKRWYDDPIAELFRPPRDLDEWHYLAQLLQARSLRTGIEWLRVNRGRCSGALVWQLNDAWPGLSWSLIDSAGREKLGYYAVKEAFRPRHLAIQPVDASPCLFAINDTVMPASYIVKVRRMALSGEVLAERAGCELGAPPGSVSEPLNLHAVVGLPGDLTHEFLVADAPGHRATWFYVPDKQLAYPAVCLQGGVLFAQRGKRSLEGRANAVMRDLVIRVEPRHGREHWNVPILKTVLPGERVFVGVAELTREDLPPPDAAEVFSRPRMWCANWFGAGT